MNKYDCVDGEGEGGRRNRGQEMALQDRTSNIYMDPNRPTPASVSDMLNEMDKKLAEQSRKMGRGFWMLGFFSLVLTGALTYLLRLQPRIYKWHLISVCCHVCRGRAAER